MSRRGVCVASAGWLLAALLGSGCGSVRYPATYVLSFPPPLETLAEQRHHAALAIRPFTCTDYVCDGRIVYRPSPEQVGFYEYHRWAADPRQMISRFVVNAVDAKRIFTHVGLDLGGSRPEYVLSGHIEELEEVDHGQDVQAVCTISARLVDGRTGSVVWSGRTSSSVPVTERNVEGVVRSLSKAAHETVERLVTSMAKELPPAGAFRP
jgi:ABC-type uncharacterized transport system auxiliary subunit